MKPAKLYVFFLYVFFLISMHVLINTPGGTGLYLSFNITSWLTISLLIGIGLIQIAKNRQIRYNQSHLIFLIGFILLCLPYFYDSPYKEHVTLQLLAVFGGLCFLVSLFQFRYLSKNKELILWLIIVATSIQLIFSFIEFFILEKGDWPWFDPTVYRPFGLLLQPNVAASLLATTICCALYLTTKIPSFDHKRHLILSVSIFACSFFISVMNSRAGYTGILLGTLLLLPHLFHKTPKQSIKNLFIMALAVILASITLTNHPVSENKKTGKNIQVRKDIYKMSVNMIIDNPIKGYGYGSFEREYLQYHSEQRQKKPELPAPALKLDHPHNETLYWAIEGGIAALLGLILFIWGYFSLFKNVVRKKALALMALITPILVHTQVEFPFYSSAPHWIIFISLLYFTSVENKASESIIKLSSPLIPSFLATITLVIFVPFFVTTLQTAAIVTKHESGGFKNIENFKNIINPLPWKSRIEANINAHKLIVGYRERNKELLEDYISWGLNRVKYSPRVSIYNNILVCLKQLNRQGEYEKILKEAKALYPEQTWNVGLSHKPEN